MKVVDSRPLRHAPEHRHQRHAARAIEHAALELDRPGGEHLHVLRVEARRP